MSDDLGTFLRAPKYVLFIVGVPVAKDQLVSSVSAPQNVLLKSPITMMISDKVVVDQNTGTVELVERAGIVVYRKAWLN